MRTACECAARTPQESTKLRFRDLNIRPPHAVLDHARDAWIRQRHARDECSVGQGQLGAVPAARRSLKPAGTLKDPIVRCVERIGRSRTSASGGGDRRFMRGRMPSARKRHATSHEVTWLAALGLRRDCVLRTISTCHCATCMSHHAQDRLRGVNRRRPTRSRHIRARDAKIRHESTFDAARSDHPCIRRNAPGSTAPRWPRARNRTGV